MSRGLALIIRGATGTAALGAEILGSEGYEVLTAKDGETGILLARERAPELILIDTNLPRVSGFEICRSIRGFTDAYIMMLARHDDEADRVEGFRSGADAFVVAPLRPPVLSARVGHIRRRVDARHSRTVRGYGALSIDLESRVVKIAGSETSVTRTEFDLLCALTDSPHRTLSRRDLMQAVWGSAIGDDHLIEVHVANLRRKLGQLSAGTGWIRTVRGIGYRFDAQGGSRTH